MGLAIPRLPLPFVHTIQIIPVALDRFHLAVLRHSHSHPQQEVEETVQTASRQHM